MPERNIIVEEKKINYSGYFDPLELETLIDNHLRDSGYVRNDISRSQSVSSQGKSLYIKKEPYKPVRDYVRIVITVELDMSNLKEAVIEKGHIKKKLYEGNLEVTLWGWLETELEFRWEKKALVYFMSQIFDRFVYKRHHNKFNSVVSNDVSELAASIKDFLAINQY